MPEGYWISYGYEIPGKGMVDGIVHVPSEINEKTAKDMIEKNQASKIPHGDYTKMLDKTLTMED